jgi:low temperature requirement protein LtrA
VAGPLACRPARPADIDGCASIDAIDALGEERRTSSVELLWDLVFVFAVTQVSTLLSRDLTWAGFGRAMLVLALVWWAWSAFVWAANAQDPDSRTLRLVLLLAMILIFVTGMAVPHAFDREAPVFAATYAAVRLLHLALYADSSRRGNASWEAIAGFAVTVVVGMALLVVGSALGGTTQVVLWSLAAAIDYAGPAWLTRERLRGLQAVAVAHFAERYGLFIIICLGESIVAIGVGAAGETFDAELVTAVALGLLVTVALWWTYFDRFAAIAEQRLRSHEDPVLAAADAYSYLHLVLVAGIIVFAVGVKLALHDVDHALPGPERLALCAGLALYLVGHVAFGMRIVGVVGREKVVVGGALLVLYAAGGGLPAWALLVTAAALLGALCVVESLRPRTAVESTV